MKPHEADLTTILGPDWRAIIAECDTLEALISRVCDGMDTASLRAANAMIAALRIGGYVVVREVDATPPPRHLPADDETNAMEFGIWMRNGIDRGWVSELTCATHDGIPSTEEENAQWEADDSEPPCEPILRVWGI